jgi:hypothetical protein
VTAASSRSAIVTKLDVGLIHRNCSTSSKSFDLDARAVQYFWCTYVPKKLEEKPAAYYVVAMADCAGAPMKAVKSYKLVVPAKMPIKQFWALTVSMCG